MKKKVCVIGLGYIGLPTAALIAKNGFSVTGVDINLDVVSKINEGKIQIIEPDLDKLIKSVISKGQLKVQSSVSSSDVYVICVPTPLKENNKIPSPNIDHVLTATRKIAKFVKPGDLIILESTSPVGTTKKIQKILVDCGIDLTNVHIAYCPERVLPGKIMTELIKNDRIVGGLSIKATKIIKDFYNLIVSGKIYETDAKTAEMCKLAENSFRDLNVAFANELSMICEKQKINIWNLIELANKHPRVNILQPSTGVGGHCIAVDPWFLVSQDIKNTKLIQSARKVNNHKTKWVIDKIKNICAIHMKKTGVSPK